jgi:HK97 family phage major capsid protein
MHPMSDVANRLRERRSSVWEEAKRLSDAAADENRQFSGEEENKWVALNSELDSLDKRISAVIEGEQRAKATEDALAGLEGRPREDGGRDQGGTGADKRKLSEYETQLRNMLSGATGAPRAIDVKPDGPVNFRTLSRLTAPAGQNTVPTTFYDQLIAHMIETSSILQAGVRVLNTTGGETIQIPKTTTHSTAGLVAEAAPIGVSDPAFAQASLSAYKYGVMVQVSRELVDDSAVDLMGYLAEETGRALGNAFGAHLVVGTGVSQPRGISLDATLGVTTATGVAGVPTGDNLIDLFYSLIAPYRNAPQAAWLMKDTSVGALRKVKDTTGQYIWQQGLVAGAPDMILGKPVLTDPFMPGTGVGAKSVLFGDFSRYFVRLAGGIRFERSDEFAFNTDLVTFRALLRGDGALIDTSGAVKYIAGAAT